jgi:hypothetical protein
MNGQVQLLLEKDYALDFQAFVCGEALALCKHCNGTSAAGQHVISVEATPTSPEVHRAIGHARRCKVVQSLKESGDPVRLGSRRRSSLAKGKTVTPEHPRSPSKLQR